MRRRRIVGFRGAPYTAALSWLAGPRRYDSSHRCVSSSRPECSITGSLPSTASPGTSVSRTGPSSAKPCANSPELRSAAFELAGRYRIAWRGCTRVRTPAPPPPSHSVWRPPRRTTAPRGDRAPTVEADRPPYRHLIAPRRPRAQTVSVCASRVRVVTRGSVASPRRSAVRTRVNGETLVVRTQPGDTRRLVWAEFQQE